MEKTTHQPTTTHPVQTNLSPEQILDPVMKKFPQKNRTMAIAIIPFIIVILLGAGTGWALAKTGSSSTNAPVSVTSKNAVASETEAGINDEAAFPDTAEGILKEGGIDGEGTHHLDRGLGPTKNVYLSSTVINLQNFVGKKVEVRGQTISGKKAGWLMDVGKVKIIQ